MAFLSKNWAALRHSGPTMSRVAVGGAWLFIVVSLLHLLWVYSVKLPDPSGLTTLYQITVDAVTYRCPLLTFDGWPGLILAMIEGVAVIAAAVMSVLPVRRLRRIGHVTLLTWVGIWTTGLIYLALLEPGDVQGLGQAGAMTVFAGCSVWRWQASARYWARRHAPRDPQRRVSGDAGRADRADAASTPGDSALKETAHARCAALLAPARIVGNCCRKVVRSVRQRQRAPDGGGDPARGPV
jgi:hypothetical protein